MMHAESGRQRGFTLIETLVVLVMVTIICIGSYALLNNFNRTDQVLENRAEGLRRYAMAMYRIGDDFRQLTVRPVKNGYNGYEPALRGDTDEIEFTRLGAANLTREPRGELQRLAYSTGYPEDADTSVTDGEDAGALLLRSRWRVLDRAPDSEPVVEPLLEGVESLNFRYFDPDTEAWLSQWPPVTSRTSTAAADRSLPRAIELVLITRSGGELRRVFNLPRVSASAGGQNTGADGTDGADGNEERADDGEGAEAGQGTEDGQGEGNSGGRDRE